MVLYTPTPQCATFNVLIYWYVNYDKFDKRGSKVAFLVIILKGLTVEDQSKEKTLGIMHHKDCMNGCFLPSTQESELATLDVEMSPNMI